MIFRVSGLLFCVKKRVQNGFRIASSTLKASESLLTGIFMAPGVILKALGVLLECSWSVYKGASRRGESSGRDQAEPGEG